MKLKRARTPLWTNIARWGGIGEKKKERIDQYLDFINEKFGGEGGGDTNRIELRERENSHTCKKDIWGKAY